ncbi:MULTISPECIES: N-acetylmuramoyl-L-alanine amidase [unclassified Roseofilum]|uniref:N-acetylmuramoyl-L-alanine amidase n=1 Tax=unclassified Roseofilum TaxID=2620099 RepID=UPI001B2C7EED|nr:MULTISPECIES: N-acetylmuramoyl-L-alanine amidase [unclassified Roseofilum]MBP0008209.1 N-acetylmuramoyl-L-alanine amidase [Roseofilum sp. Belize Diploria]MBP0015489.1 N-acetylmuramoyl-L-alanine amidase [Roseofilum sp. SID3]MBP0023193.1 N-acetylmuramoyl-L-alanine amidase [Roseofilum sp. SID2]MBP0039915.1 N-acetylmuramoyl-L-alanine amidase [Roseofilum sp. SID1]MBP0041525.1 N-acetylmuramoyl-L-alanine amidase [Roseofilum sp. SBFL]
MKLHWLLPGVLGLWLLSSPVYAASLQNWRFDARSNRLEFTTDTNVQPRAQLIYGPTRLVIDLPGIQLGRQLRQQLVNTPGIAQVRTGQFNSNTTRLVIELKPGYTIDPNQVKFQGISPRRWVVQIPNPQRDRRPITPPPVSSPQPAPPSSASSVVEAIRVTGDGFYLRVNGEKPNVKSVKRTSNQQEITIDFEGVTLASDLHQRPLVINSRGVRQIQMSQLQDSIVRVTLDVTPASPDWQGLTNKFGAVIIPVSGSRGQMGQEAQQPWPANRELVSANASVGPSPTQPPSPLPTQDGIAINVPPPAKPLPPPAPRPQPLPPPTTNPRPSNPRPPRNSRIRVAIDPGHGGRDPGAVGNGLLEKEIVMDISNQVAAILEQNGVQTVMTRRDDREIDLAPRVATAERANATLFVSIHANAISLSRPEVNGLETFYYQTGQRLARDIHNTILQTLNIRDRGVRRARFYVLRKTSMPSVLVETGFITGREDSVKLANPVFRRQMAQGIANGILRHIQQNY